MARRLGTPAFRPAPRAAAPRDRASPTAKKRGDGLERRSPTGIARERETCTNDAGCQREHHSMPRTAWNADLWPVHPGGFRPAQPRALHSGAPPFQHRRNALPTAARAWSAGLRPASRGSAKPAPMTPGPANVSPAPHHAVGVTRTDPIMWVPAAQTPACRVPTPSRNACCQRQQTHAWSRRSPTGIARERSETFTNRRMLPSEQERRAACSGQFSRLGAGTAARVRTPDRRMLHRMLLGLRPADQGAARPELRNRRMLRSSDPEIDACLGPSDPEIDACLGQPTPK